MEWFKSKILKKLFLETTDWNVAWKKENSNCYNVIDNPEGYWLADSLVFSCCDGIFLFVEAFDKKENIGKIAVLEYDGELFKNFKIILEKDYHLSYPYVFEFEKEYYMIPETSGNNCIEIYKAKKFPYEWEKETELLKGCYVDTTIHNDNNKGLQLYSYDMKKYERVTGTLNLKKYKIENIITTKDSDYQFRAGGNVFEKDGNLFRAVQNNEFFYGQKLNIIDCNNSKIVDELQPTQINNDKKKIYRRLHTYSKSGVFEAVDLSDYRFNLFKFLKKIKGVLKK